MDRERLPDRIGPYRVERELGRGGGGVVYLAVDAALGRSVAIKALPAELAGDGERLARLEREARALASVGHPNVATIHGLETTDDGRYLVLEFVDGESLDVALRRGPLPLPDALECARQIADGLEAVHERGLVHRDLKPANVRRAPDGTVKVLDFGLAKSTTPATTDTAVTMRDAIVGTPAYLAPEQARGAPLDRRVDVWAFGCVLFELLTARRAFAGETLPDVFRAIVEFEPDWDALPAGTPPRVRELLKRCLEKDPRRRLRDLGDARLELEAAIVRRDWSRTVTPDELAGPRAARRGSRASIAFAVGAGLALVASLLWPRDVAVTPTTRTAVFVGRTDTGGELEVNWRGPVEAVRIAPDGRTLAVRLIPRQDAPDRLVTSRLYLRRLESDALEPVPGSGDVRGFDFSPDGRSLCMVTTSSAESWQPVLVRVPVDGGTEPERVCAWRADTVRWLPNGEFVGGLGDPFGLLRVRDDGSTQVEFELAADGFVPVFDPQVHDLLPDGRTLLLDVQTYEAAGFAMNVAIADLETGATRILLRDAGSPRWSATGHLVFSRADRVLVAEFDAATGAVRGTPAPLAVGAGTPSSWEHAQIELSDAGTLVHLPGGVRGARRFLALVGPDGEVERWSNDELALADRIEASWDASRLCVTRVAASGLYEIWGSETATPRLRPLVREVDADCDNGVLSADGAFLVYARSGRGGTDGLYRRAFDGTGPGELLLAARAGNEYARPIEIAPDDGTLLMTRSDRGTARLYLLALSGGDPIPVVGPDADTGYAGFSPDGRWLAYVVTIGGRTGAFVRSYDATTRALGPEQTVPLPIEWRPWGVSFSKTPPDRPPEMWFSLGLRRYAAIPITGDGAPARFGEPRVLRNLERVRFLDEELMPDDRILCIARGADEPPTERIALVQGLDALIRAALSR